MKIVGKNDQERISVTSTQATPHLNTSYEPSFKEMLKEDLSEAIRESLRASLQAGSAEAYFDRGVLNPVYKEMDPEPVVHQDPLLTLQSNVEVLSDLVHRWSFVMKENRYLLKM